MGGPPFPKAVLLDLDDTILDDSSTVDTCWKHACDAHRLDFAGLDPSELYGAIRERGQWYWSDPERHRAGRLDLEAARAEVVRLALAELGVDGAGVAGRIARTYSHSRDSSMQPLPDAIDTVRWLRGRGCKLALLTNGAGDAQRRKISRFDLAGLFDCILIEGETGFGKPDERIYRRALETLGVVPEEAWMVGDHIEFDVAAPQKMGLFTVWIDVNGRGVPPGMDVRPDLIVRALSELRSGNISPLAAAGLQIGFQRVHGGNRG
jgi:putative hydrolase of the HAD superfamily